MGLNKYCRSCVSEIYFENRAKIAAGHKRYYERTKQHHSQRMKEWRAKNAEYMRVYKQKYYKEHRAELVRYSTEWCKAHPEQTKRNMSNSHHRHPQTRNENETRRRARKRSVYIEKVDRLAVIARDKATCQICGKGPLTGFTLTLDHIVPIAKGGPHTATNLRVACRSCNCRKGARL